VSAPAHRLGFAYQIAFVRLFNRFPRQQPFEIVDELASSARRSWDSTRDCWSFTANGGQHSQNIKKRSPATSDCATSVMVLSQTAMHTLPKWAPLSR
jgi:hypothetical protein